MRLDFGFALAARGLSGVLLAAALLATTLTAQAQALPQPGLYAARP